MQKIASEWILLYTSPNGNSDSDEILGFQPCQAQNEIANVLSLGWRLKPILIQQPGYYVNEMEYFIGT